MKKLTSVIAVVLVLAFALGSVAYAVESRSMLGTLKTTGRLLCYTHFLLKLALDALLPASPLCINV